MSGLKCGATTKPAMTDVAQYGYNHASAMLRVKASEDLPTAIDMMPGMIDPARPSMNST